MVPGWFLAVHAVIHDFHDSTAAVVLGRMLLACYLQAKLMVDAQAGDRNALLQLMTDQTANVYGEDQSDSCIFLRAWLCVKCARVSPTQ